MIKLRAVNKYYNLKRCNELHVLKDITLSFEKTGLVAIVGQSGSGKSTLLNCIGGLDEFNFGEYNFLNHENKYTSKSLLKQSSKNIGFVFQDYQLIDDATVEENILLAIQISRQTRDIEKVNIVLDAVGMAKYNNRKVNTLSAGQKQRIAISRALSINPCVILADEPTGNLDNKNSVQIMRLLRDISKETLVVIVSHNLDLIKTFADRIIEIDNAQIVSDTLNTKNDSVLNASDDIITPINSNVIMEKYNSHGIEIIFFYTSNLPTFKHLQISVDGKQIAIKTDANLALTSEINESEPQAKIEPGLNSPSIGPETKIKDISIRSKISNCNTQCKKLKHKSIALFSTKSQKISAIIMIITAVLLALSAGLFNNAITIDPLKYRESSSKAIAISIYENNSLQKIYDLEQNTLIEYLVPYISPMQLKYTNKGLMQTTFIENEDINFLLKPLPLKLIETDEIIFGKMPVNPFEAVIDKFYIDSLTAKAYGEIGRGAMYGIASAKSYLGGELYLTEGLSIKIVGISNTNTPTIYLWEDIILSLTLQRTDGGEELMLSDNVATFISNEILFDNNLGVYISHNMYINSGYTPENENHLTIFDTQYNVLGYFESDLEFSAYILTSAELKRMAFAKLASSAYSEAIIKDDVKSAIDSILGLGIFSRSLLEVEYESYLSTQRPKMTLQLVFTVAVAIAALLSCYFSTKSSIAEKKKFLAIKVVLGEPRIRLLGDFISRDLLFFATFAMPVYIIMGLVIKFVLSYADGIFSMINLSFASFLYGILILLAIPLFSTIIALVKYLYKKPVELLKE
ncbi:MAG: ATP-binding cassette domain-containing protein [Christensenellaceae bacterium]|jgi:ABC-type lipoprotein export system ATPase subunit|nr:ATP-binding cassette domain-containing protein [Christensenellaceae bacterium]